MSMSQSNCKWENAIAGAVAGFATVAAIHPLDVVRTRFQVNDGRLTNLPTYRNTSHAILSIARLEVCLCTNPIWLVKTRLQLQTPLHQTQSYSGLYDALKTIMKEEGWRALYRGIVPGLVLVVTTMHHCFVFLTVISSSQHEELCKRIVDYKSKSRKNNGEFTDMDLLVVYVVFCIVFVQISVPKYRDCHSTLKPNCRVLMLYAAYYALLGGSSKIAAIILTSISGYSISIAGPPRFEGFRGFHKGITANLLKNVPASSVTFTVYENVLKLLKLQRRKED